MKAHTSTFLVFLLIAFFMTHFLNHSFAVENPTLKKMDERTFKFQALLSDLENKLSHQSIYLKTSEDTKKAFSEAVKKFLTPETQDESTSELAQSILGLASLSLDQLIVYKEVLEELRKEPSPEDIRKNAHTILVLISTRAVGMNEEPENSSGTFTEKEITIRQDSLKNLKNLLDQRNACLAKIVGNPESSGSVSNTLLDITKSVNQARQNEISTLDSEIEKFEKELESPEALQALTTQILGIISPSRGSATHTTFHNTWEALRSAFVFSENSSEESIKGFITQLTMKLFSIQTLETSVGGFRNMGAYFLGTLYGKGVPCVNTDLTKEWECLPEGITTYGLVRDLIPNLPVDEVLKMTSKGSFKIEKINFKRIFDIIKILPGEEVAESDNEGIKELHSIFTVRIAGKSKLNQLRFKRDEFRAECKKLDSCREALLVCEEQFSGLLQQTTLEELPSQRSKVNALSEAYRKIEKMPLPNQ